jgi:hypothetical protein
VFDGTRTEEGVAGARVDELLRMRRSDPTRGHPAPLPERRARVTRTLDREVRRWQSSFGSRQAG